MRRHTSHMTVAALIAATLSVASCSRPANDYSGYSDLGADGWIYGDTISFVPQTTDTVATGDIVVSLRHTPDYAWRNIWLEVTVMADSAATAVARRDTVSIDLCDAYGRWYGNGIGVSYQLSDTVARGVTRSAAAPVYVRHIMRADTLRGIEQLGVLFAEHRDPAGR